MRETTNEQVITQIKHILNKMEDPDDELDDRALLAKKDQDLIIEEAEDEDDEEG